MTGAYCEILYSLYPFLSSHTYLRTLFNARRRSRSPIAIRNPRSRARMARIGHLAPTLVRTTMNTALYLPIHLTLEVRSLTCVRARALSLLFSLPFVLRWSDQRVAKVEANHHAITAPGTAGTPTRSQKAATAFCRPGAFTTAVPMLQNQQSSSCVPRKKRASLSPRFPPSFRQITGGPTDRPTTGIRGIHRGE